MEKEKPSFAQSTTSGLIGAVKGAFTGIPIGALAGAVIGGIIGFATGGTDAILGALWEGMGMGGTITGSVGAVAGTMTGVVMSRESAQVSGEDVANVAKISYAQGVMVGHNVAQEQQAEVTTKFRDKVAQQRTQAQQAQKMH